MIMLRKTFALFFCVIMLTVALFTDVTAAENKEEKVTQFSEIQSVSEENSYKNYKESIKEFTVADTEIVIDAKDYTEGSTVKLIQGDLYGENSGIIFENSGDKAVYSFNVDTDGIYNIKVDYAAIEKTTMDIQMAVYIDGKILWDDLEKIELFRWWKDATKVWNLDKEGNEVPPEQIEAFGFREQYLFDVSGLEADYYQFYFSKGSHTIEFLLKQEPVAFKQITLTAPQNLEKASEVVKKIKAKDYTGDDLIIQGEAAFEKSSFSLAPKSDSLSADVQPQSPYKNVINYIGATTWDSPWQTLKWQVDIGEAAFYKLGFHFKQSAVVNADVYRDIKIDGKAPFSEAKEYSFGYDSDWQYKTLNNNDGKPCKIFLDEGIHTIELSVTLGPTAEYIRRLENILEVIGDEYLKISMITGETPDMNRDYELFSQIPDLENSFKWCIEELNVLSKIMVDSSGESSQYVTTVKGTTRILEQMTAKKYLAHTYKKDLYTQYTNLSSILYEMRSMPLSLDEIRLSAPNSKAPKYANWWDTLKYNLFGFLASFSSDYNVANENNENVTLKIWTTWGRDQTQVLNSLIAESFTPKYGIEVDIQITAATLVQGMLTGRAPDLSLGLTRSSPVDFAMRGALVKLSDYDDFDEVMTRFNAGSAEAYRYKGDYYALPDTQNFYIMYYRKDVLENLGITKIPETWDEFIETSAIIQRNNMRAYLPDASGMTILATLLEQNNVPLYNDERTANLLDRDDAVSVFEWWTKLYTEYKFDVTADFYNRFRIGTMPLGIASYTTYTQLVQTATDIEGRWGIALIPGVRDEEGNINRATADSGTGCAILKDSKHQDEAWEFLKWWTSADTQYRYSKNVETILGPIARIATSNKEAFSNYAWNNDDASIFMEQWEHVISIPELPGSYYMTRSVEQAFLSVVNKGTTPTDAMIRWSSIANEEITRKIKEYS